MIPLEVVRVGQLQRGGEHVLVLRERGGRRFLPITIGRFEAMAIQRALDRAHTARPSAHDLLVSVITRLGGRLERVCIHDLRDDTFFSQLELAGDVGLLEVDCRTSDAVALAVRLACPILADEDVLARAAVVPRPRAGRWSDDEAAPGHGP